MQTAHMQLPRHMLLKQVGKENTKTVIVQPLEEHLCDNCYVDLEWNIAGIRSVIVYTYLNHQNIYQPCVTTTVLCNIV